MKERNNNSNTTRNYHNLVPPHILEGLHTFCTKSFLVRYSEEEVPLDCIIQFKCILDYAILKKSLPFYLEVEMMFSDLSNLTGPKRIIGLTASKVK